MRSSEHILRDPMEKPGSLAHRAKTYRNYGYGFTGTRYYYAASEIDLEILIETFEWTIGGPRPDWADTITEY